MPDDVPAPDEVSDSDQAKLREGWGGKAAQHTVGCGCRSRQHRVMWGAWAAIAFVLTILGVCGAALASAGLFSDAKKGGTLAELGAWLGAVAAAAAALNLWVAPQVKTHKIARDGFAALVSRFDDFARVTAVAEAF